MAVQCCANHILNESPATAGLHPNPQCRIIWEGGHFLEREDGGDEQKGSTDPSVAQEAQIGVKWFIHLCEMFSS